MVEQLHRDAPAPDARVHEEAAQLGRRWVAAMPVIAYQHMTDHALGAVRELADRDPGLSQAIRFSQRYGSAGQCIGYPSAACTAASTIRHSSISPAARSRIIAALLAPIMSWST